MIGPDQFFHWTEHHHNSGSDTSSSDDRPMVIARLRPAQLGNVFTPSFTFHRSTLTVRECYLLITEYRSSFYDFPSAHGHNKTLCLYTSSSPAQVQHRIQDWAIPELGPSFQGSPHTWYATVAEVLPPTYICPWCWCLLASLEELMEHTTGPRSKDYCRIHADNIKQLQATCRRLERTGLPLRNPDIFFRHPRYWMPGQTSEATYQYTIEASGDLQAHLLRHSYEWKQIMTCPFCNTALGCESCLAWHLTQRRSKCTLLYGQTIPGLLMLKMNTHGLRTPENSNAFWKFHMHRQHAIGSRRKMRNHPYCPAHAHAEELLAVFHWAKLFHCLYVLDIKVRIGVCRTYRTLTKAGLGQSVFKTVGSFLPCQSKCIFTWLTRAEPITRQSRNRYLTNGASRASTG